MFQCPLCFELVDILTNNHCTSKHNMTKKELMEKYGRPKEIRIVHTKEEQEWLRQQTNIISISNFGYAQAAVKSQLRKP